MQFIRAPRGKVLLADDNEDIRSLLAQLIEWEGWQVVEARNGREALDKVLEERPDVLILDYRMPGLNGEQVCRRIRELGLHVPVVLITAEHGGKQLAAACGVHYYLAKPFNSTALLALLERACQKG